jgi:hypothetical protein
MRPAFGDLPAVDDEDLVRCPDRGQPVGDHQGRPTGQRGRKCPLDRHLGLESTMISRKISVLTTTMADSTAVMPSSSTICQRYRRRYGQTRRTVPGRTCCRVTSSSRY